jgi:hypothetical protein
MTRYGKAAYLARHLDRNGAAVCGNTAPLTTGDPGRVTCENCRAIIRAYRRLADQLPYLRPAMDRRLGGK